VSDLPPTWHSPGAPPPFPPPPPPPSPRKSVGLWIALALVALLLVGGGIAAAVVLSGGQEAVAGEVVMLEPATESGPAPFVSTVAITPVTAFPEAVRAVSATTASGLAADPATGTRTAVGTADNLFGGSGELGTCDRDELVDFLSANPAPAAAWAGVHGIAPDRIADYVATLTPVVLLLDTAVTNYGFSGGVATPRQSVLQAGTAVLIDDTGTPAVRCACGNPLSAPTVRDLPAGQLLGTRWDGFDPAATVAVSGGPRVQAFTLVDVSTGASYQRPAGLASLSRPALLAATPAGIQRSEDGQSWTTVATTEQGAPARLDASPDLVVAVGGVRDDGANQPSGTIVTSADGSTWSDPIATPDYLVDVAHGDGGWLALGVVPYTDPRDATIVSLYRSGDGIAWERQEVTLPGQHSNFGLPDSIDYAAGNWLIVGHDDVGDSAIPLAFTSPDGAAWAEQFPVNSSAYPEARAHNGQVWGMTGAQLFFDNGLEQLPRSELRVGAGADGINWQPTPGTPVNLRVTTLACTGDRGWLGAAVDTGPTGWIGAVHTSPDLVSWTPLGTSPEGGVTDVIAVGDGTAPDANRCAVPAAPVECVLDQQAADGTPLVAVPEPGVSIGCDEMRSRWTAYDRWTGPRGGTAGFVDFGDGWSCSVIPLSAQLPGQSGWGWDGRLGGCVKSGAPTFAAFPENVATGGAPPPPPAPSSAAGSTTGDLGLSQPMSTPACDGTGIVIVASAIHPESYPTDVQAGLDRFPGSRYLRTDLTGCSSLNHVSSIGTKIYAVYLPMGTDVAAICAEAGRTGGYGKWLNNTSDPTATISCG
jgi:hypothetical protein